MNETLNLCVKRLINEIQSRPAIWDSRIKEYSDRAIKKEAWEELCAEFVPNYHATTIAEKNGITAVLQKKWKNIRDSFLRELKRSHGIHVSGKKCNKPYAYFDNCMFLSPVCEIRPLRKEDDETSYTINETLTVEYDENEDSDNNDNNSGSIVIYNDNKAEDSQPTRKGRRPEETEETEETVLNMLADHIKHKRKRESNEDPDRQFLLSLLPDLQSMDASVKFNLKYEIMGVIKRYKQENIRNFIATYTE